MELVYMLILHLETSLLPSLLGRIRKLLLQFYVFTLTVFLGLRGFEICPSTASPHIKLFEPYTPISLNSLHRSYQITLPHHV